MTNETTPIQSESTDHSIIPESDTQVMQDVFAKNLAAAEAAPETEPEPEQVAPTPKAKEPAKPAESDLPEELITGKKAEAPKHDETDAFAKADAAGQKVPKALREAHEANKARIAEYEAKVKDYEAKLAQSPAPVEDKQTKEQLETISKRAAELEAKLERADFQNSPKFQQLVTKSQTIVGQAKAYIAGSEVPESVIDRAAAANGAARIKILNEAELDPVTSGAILSHLAQNDVVSGEMRTALDSHAQTKQQWQAEQERSAAAKEEQTKAQERQVFSTIKKDFASKLAPFQRVEGNDAWNSGVDALEKEAEAFFNGDYPLEKLAEIAFTGVAYNRLSRINDAMRQRMTALESENVKLKSAQPGGGSEHRQPGSAEVTSTGNPIADATRAFEQRMGR